MQGLRYGLTALILAAAAAPLAAQSPDATAPSTSRPAAAPSVSPVPATAAMNQDNPPYAGANSFTQSQAVERIQKSGFTGVQNLKQDENGVWRGDASKNGQSVKVSLDFRGNVTQQ